MQRLSLINQLINISADDHCQRHRSPRSRTSAQPRRSRGRPSAGDDATVRESLLEAARRLFLAHGFAAVSIREIAAAAGTTAAMIHYYFGDKLGLYRAMLEARMRVRFRAALEHMRSRGADIRDRHRRADPALHADARRQSMGAAADRAGGAGRGRPLPHAVHRAVRGPARADVRRGAAARAGRGAVAADVDPRLAAVSAISLCVFPFVSLPVTSRVLGLSVAGEVARASRRAHGARVPGRARPSEVGRMRSLPSGGCSSVRCRVARTTASGWWRMGTLERDRLELIAESNERIVAIAVHEGERVAAGTELVRQEAGTMQPRLVQARAAVAEAEQRLAELVKRPPRARDRRGTGGTRRRREHAAHAGAGIRARRVAGRKEARQRIRTRPRARRARPGARQPRSGGAPRSKLLREGTRTRAGRAGPRGRRSRARGVLAELEVSAARYLVRAPRAGLVEALPYKLGERPPTGAPLVVMLADGIPYARVYVPEPLRAAFHAGAAVTVDGRWSLRIAARPRALRLGRGDLHAVLRADAEGSHPAELPRRNRHRRSARRRDCRSASRSRSRRRQARPRRS